MFFYIAPNTPVPIRCLPYGGGLLKKLYELLYTSELALKESPSCIASILRVSRGNNLREHISGLLVFDGLRFCQYLEGPKEAVLRLAETIRRDPRHVLFTVQDQGALTGERRFAGHSMAYGIAEAEQIIPSLSVPHLESPIVRLQRLLPTLSVIA